MQVWDFMTGRLRKDLQYQADEQFMLHDSPVIALALSRDSDLLASGSQDGKIKACHVSPARFMLCLDLKMKPAPPCSCALLRAAAVLHWSALACQPFSLTLPHNIGSSLVRLRPQLLASSRRFPAGLDSISRPRTRRCGR